MDLRSRSQCSIALLLHGHQLTGLCVCHLRYGLVSIDQMVGVRVTLPVMLTMEYTDKLLKACSGSRGWSVPCST